MAEQAARGGPAPSQTGTRQQAAEVFGVQRLEHRVQVIMTTLWAGDELVAANLADQMHLPPDISPVQVEPVAVAIDSGSRAAEEFAQQNLGQGFLDRRRSSLQQIRDSNVDHTGLQADEAVSVGETAEFHVDLWQWGTRFEFPENAGVDFFRAFEKQSALKSGDGQTRAVVLHFSTI